MSVDRAPPAPPPAVSERELERIALEHLKRFPSSSVHLGRVLQRRIERRAVRAGASSEQGRQAAHAQGRTIQAVVERLARAGLVDDEAYARGLTASLFARGQSRAAIRRRLFEKGIAAEVIEQSLARLADDIDEPPDLVAARALVRRKRLGPFRRGPADPRTRQRELAALARAGFGYAVAQRVLDEVPGEEDAP